MASTKTATVNVRIQEDVKQQAEQILSTIGVPRATAIDMFYRQIILHRGIPFELALPQGLPVQEDLSKAEFDHLLATGYAQARAGVTQPADAVFASLEKGL